MDKQSARNAGLAGRRSIPASKRQDYDAEITQQACLMAMGYDVIGCYVSLEDETDTMGIISWCLDHHKKVCVPRTGKTMLVFHEITSFDDLEHGVLNILEPKKDTPVVDPKDIELMFVPLLAFDEEGHRVGHGAGYYDRYLTEDMVKAGLAYPQQKVDSIETTANDADLDLVISCLP